MSKKAHRRNETRRQRLARDQGIDLLGVGPITDIAPRPRSRAPVEARTEAQGHYLIAMAEARLVFATGPSGTGKTFLCAATAAEALENKRIERIIITRPAVEAEEQQGFLPGDLDQKFDPYLRPFKDAIAERLGDGHTDYLFKTKRIEAAPLGFMRGRTFRNAFVILDEAQNTTPNQMKLFLTRIGEGSTVVVNGDITQKDIPGPSGLEDAIRKLSHLRRVRLVEFTRADVVRSGIVQEIVEAYEQAA